MKNLHLQSEAELNFSGSEIFEMQNGRKLKIANLPLETEFGNKYSVRVGLELDIDVKDSAGERTIKFFVQYFERPNGTYGHYIQTFGLEGPMNPDYIKIEMDKYSQWSSKDDKNRVYQLLRLDN